MTEVPQQTSQKKQRFAPSMSVGEISNRLTQQAETVASYLLPNGRRDGLCWVAASIDGGKGDSLKVVLSGEKAGRWADHNDKQYHGDLIDLFQFTQGVEKGKAVKAAKEFLGIHDRKPTQRTAMPKPRAEIIKPPPDTWKGMKKIHTWDYTHEGQKIGCVVRYEDGQGHKEVIPFFQSNGKAGIPKGLSIPLYGRTDPAYVFVTEGEKDVDAVLQLGLAAITSQGGSGAARKADWSALKSVGKVFLLPDNDKAGQGYVRDVITILQAQNPERELKIIELDGLPEKGDIVDWIKARFPDWDEYSEDERIKTLKGELRKLAGKAEDVQPASVEDWPEREPLPARYDVMPFDYELLPAKLRPYIELGTHTMQCPPDYIATSCMVALGSLIGRKVCIRPKKRDDWVVVPNLWGGNVGLSTAMKSPAQDFGMRHLERIANNAIEIHKEERRLSAPQRRRLEAEVHALSQKLKNHYRDSSKSEINPEMVSEDLAKCEAELEELNDQHATRYWTTDSTIEKLAVLLNQNPNGLLNKRDELIGWFRSMDRPGREGDRAFFLESASGTQSITHDRIGRGTIHCEGLCLSIHGSIQPGPLQHYVTDALGDGVGADGLLQRFQLMVWPDPIKQWRYVDESLESANDALAASVFDHLVDITAESVGATVPEDGVPYLRFSDAAQEVFIQWFTELHREKVPNAEHEALRSHLGKYPSLMPSLALILHLADGHAGPVSMEAAVKAADWCEYLGTHARRVYLSNTRPDVVAAHRILGKVEEGAITHAMKVREIIRAQWSGLNSRERVEAGLGVLEEYGWLRVERVDTGGRPSDQINLHPDIRNTNKSSSFREADHG